MLPQTENIILVITKIPKGKVLTYGRVAALAGIPNGARQVVRALHTQGKKYNLPWHRVVNIKGEIAIKEETGASIQKDLLEMEGVIFENNKIDLNKYLWSVNSLSEIDDS